MDGDRTNRAIARIDTALQRLENIGTRLQTDNGSLQSRNHRIETAAKDALSRIDALLAQQNG